MKYKVTIGVLWHDGIRYVRGDVIETDEDLGTRAEPLAEAVEPTPVAKPKRKRRTKAEIEAEKMQLEIQNALDSVPSVSGASE